MAGRTPIRLDNKTTLLGKVHCPRGIKPSKLINALAESKCVVSRDDKSVNCDLSYLFSFDEKNRSFIIVCIF
jgi:hypothetical protein